MKDVESFLDFRFKNSQGRNTEYRSASRSNDKKNYEKSYNVQNGYLS